MKTELRQLGNAVVNVSRLLIAAEAVENGKNVGIFIFDNGQEATLRKQSNVPLVRLITETQNHQSLSLPEADVPPVNTRSDDESTVSSASIAPTASSKR